MELHRDVAPIWQDSWVGSDNNLVHMRDERFSCSSELASQLLRTCSM